MKKFKVGDLVTCSESYEIEQPMTIEGYNSWFVDGPTIYLVKGKHQKKGNWLTINLSEGILSEFSGSLV